VGIPVIQQVGVGMTILSSEVTSGHPFPVWRGDQPQQSSGGDRGSGVYTILFCSQVRTCYSDFISLLFISI
jgi:hypothetical protein